MKKSEQNNPEVNADQTSTYEQLLEQIEVILTQLDQKEIALDVAVDKYKQGMSLIDTCNAKLDRAEKELKVIEGV